MITFLCGKCGKRLQVADEVAGKKCRCPSCTTINVVPNSLPSGSSTYSNTTPPPGPPPSQSSLGDIFPSANSGASSSSSFAGGLWDGLNTPSSNGSSAQANNPYAAYQTPTPPPSQPSGPPNYMPQYGGGYLPEASPLGMIFGVISVVMPLFICFYGLSIPLGLVFGMAAWIVSSNDRKKVAQGIIRTGLADVGYTLGIIGTIINGLLLLLIAAFVIFVIVAAANGNMN
ncbi:MAG: hypothetical protein U0930_13225 [Pirellulales bacterium]